MKKVLKIKEIVLYCEKYSEESENNFFLDLNDYKIRDRDEMKHVLGYTDSQLNDEISLEYNFSVLPVFRVNIPLKIIEFLKTDNQWKLLKKLENCDYDRICGEFDHKCNWDEILSGHWNDFIIKTEKEIAVKWCEEHNISYEL